MSESLLDPGTLHEKPANGFTASPKALSTVGSINEYANGEEHEAVEAHNVNGGGHMSDEGGDEDEEDDEDEEGDGEDEEEGVTDEEGEDEDDEDEDEPALKYERFGGELHDLLQKDSASSITYANKRLVSTFSDWIFLIEVTISCFGLDNRNACRHSSRLGHVRTPPQVL